MNHFSLDASALLKRYAVEPGTAPVNHLFQNVDATRMAALAIGVADVYAALVRKRNNGKLTPPDFQSAVAFFQVEVIKNQNQTLLHIDPSMIAPSFSLIEKHSLNATDALFLHIGPGCAMEAGRT